MGEKTPKKVKKEKKAKSEKKSKSDKKRKSERSPDKSAKKRKREESGSDSNGEEEKPVVPITVSVIAKPLASDELKKKLLKLTKKAAKARHLKRGVKEVVKAIRKDTKGLCIIAGDINPIDVISHLALYCEEKELPYIYVPSKAELGTAAATKRPTSCVLLTYKEKGKEFDHKDALKKLASKCKAANPYVK